MWRVKQLDEETKKFKIVKDKFSSKEEADLYISINMREIEDVRVEEVMEQDAKIIEDKQIENKMGKWIWLFSEKRKEFFPYGVIKEIMTQFVKIQTREHLKDEGEYVDMRLAKITELLLAGKLAFKDEGVFVVINEYL